MKHHELQDVIDFTIFPDEYSNPATRKQTMFLYGQERFIMSIVSNYAQDTIKFCLTKNINYDVDSFFYISKDTFSFMENRYIDPYLNVRDGMALFEDDMGMKMHNAERIMQKGVLNYIIKDVRSIIEDKTIPDNWGAVKIVDNISIQDKILYAYKNDILIDLIFFENSVYVIPADKEYYQVEIEHKSTKSALNCDFSNVYNNFHIRIDKNDLNDISKIGNDINTFYILKDNIIKDPFILRNKKGKNYSFLMITTDKKFHKGILTCKK